MSETSEKTPEWLVLLENKKKRHNRLAHEIGAGAPCLNCGDSCPGLDLHFWRKLCRNCKCKKEDHDVKDDEGYEQFEILLGPGSKKRKRGACLNIKVPEIQDGAKQPKSSQVPFDWIPPNVTDDVAAEYMNQLPAAKLPISGSDGALYRRQQLERQVPIHDLDASRCHNLTPQEVEGLTKYLENLKSNVVGQGRVTKVPLHYAEVHWASGDSHHKFLPASQSADSIHSIPPPPFSAPRPFQPTVSHNLSANDDELLPPPPPLPKTLPPSLKKPSNFVPNWKSYNNPESQIAYSEALLGKPSFTSVEHKKSGLTATDRTSVEGHDNNKMLGNATYQHYSSLPNESAASLPVDGTISMTVNPRNMAYSANSLGLSNPMISLPLIQGSAVSGATNEQSIPFAKNTTVPCAEVIAGSRHPSGGGQYLKPQTGTLLSEDAAHKLKGTNTMEEDDVHCAASPPGTKNKFSQQPALLLHSAAGTAGLQNLVWNNNAPAKIDDINNGLQNKEKEILAGFISDKSDTYGMADSLAADSTLYSSFGPHGETVHSESVLTGSLPRQKGVVAGSIIDRGANYGMTNPVAAKGTVCSGGPHTETVYSEGVPTGSMPRQTGLISDRGNTYRTADTLGAKGNVYSSLGPHGEIVYSQSVPTGATPKWEEVLAGSTSNKGVTCGMTNSAPAQGSIFSLGPKGETSSSESLQIGALPKQTGFTGVGGDSYGMADPLAAKSNIYSSLGPHGETVYSEGVPTDALPKSALAMQQHRHDMDVSELSSHMAEMKTDDNINVQQPQFNCRECEGTILAGDVAVFADRAGQDVAWHPSCFVCTTCKELLVDLIYFFNKGKVYCGRHYAELLKIPRCYACDELIFVNEYTMAEGQAFHVKHFCCYECDIPLGGMKYVPVDGQPVCLDCFQEKYGKSCHACKKKIGASDQRVSWKDLHWHVTGECFSCFSCRKSLLGGRFVVKQNQPFCSKECVLASGAI